MSDCGLEVKTGRAQEPALPSVPADWLWPWQVLILVNHGGRTEPGGGGPGRAGKGDDGKISKCQTPALEDLVV